MKGDIMAQKLYRSSNDKMIGGVAGGMAEYFNIDPVILRVLFVLLLFAWGASFFFYILLWIIVPLNPKHRFEFNSEFDLSSEETASFNERKKHTESRKNVFAGILITIGLIWLLGNMFPGFDVSWVLPLGLIGLGVFILYKDQILTNKTGISHE
jgi:phage shock protein C